jgi:diguanylate cyclase (GGDEF)-like protein
MPIKYKLILMFILISIIPMGIIGMISFSSTKNALEQTTVAGLEVAAEFVEGEIVLYLENLKTSTIDFSSDGFIRDSLEGIISQHTSIADLTSNLNDHLLRNKLPLNKDLLFIDIIDLNGKVRGSSAQNRVGLNFTNEVYFQKAQQQLYVSDIHQFANGAFEIIVAAPLTTRSKPSNTIGVIINHFKAESINELLTGQLLKALTGKGQKRGLGKTGETYLVNKDKLIISDSLHMENSRFKQIVETYPVIQCFQEDAEVSGAWINYQGTPVVGASTIISFDDTKWALITEQEAEEAFSQINNIRNKYIAAILQVLIITTIIAFVIARTIGSPLRKLIDSIDEIKNGNLNAKVDGINSKDEIGYLAASFNEMSDNLRKASTVLERKNKQLEELSIKDGLTGIYNHRFLKERLHHEFDRCIRYKTPLSCLLIDIDYFKSINDTYGHLFGDRVLRELGLIMKENTRSTDYAGRYGGEEFMVILPNTLIDKAEISAKLIHSAIQDHVFKQNDISIHLTVSIGVSGFVDGDKEFSTLIENADIALYQAKNNGRNMVVTHNHSQD